MMSVRAEWEIAKWMERLDNTLQVMDLTLQKLVSKLEEIIKLSVPQR
jgi:hypothetical protein